MRFRLWNIHKMREVTTPKTRFGLLALASVAWLALIPAIFLQIQMEYRKDDLRPMTDTGHGMFLIGGIPFFIFTCVAIVLFGRFVLLRHSTLPVNIWIWRTDAWNLVWTVICAVLVAFLGIAAVWSAANFPWSIPSVLTGIYIALSTRAALLSRPRHLATGLPLLDKPKVL